MRKQSVAAVEMLESRCLMSGTLTTGTITGTLFYDASASAIYKSSDSGISGRTLYIDVLNKGVFAAGDPTATTNSTGKFTFSNLKAGTFIVRDEAPSGRAVDVPAAGFATATLSVSSPKATLLIGEKAVPTVNFVGQYEIFTGGALYDVDIRRVGTSLSSYTGDIVTNGTDAKFTAIESTSNVLSGAIAASGGSVAFTATLSGKTFTVTYTKSKTHVVLTQVSTTPGAPLPALTQYTGSLFSYVKPASWTETQTASGMVIQSPDGTQQVGAIGSVANGAFNLSSIAASEQKAGATILFDKVLQSKTTLTTQYQSGVALITFMRNGVLYASAQEVETYIFSNKGIYNSKTKTYSGVTLTEIYEASAPKSVWVSDNATMIYMMTSIKSNSSLTSTGGAPAGSKPVAFSNPGLFDPGTIGAWSVNGLFNAYYKSSYFDIAEGNLLNYETLALQESVNSSVNSFCNYLLS